MAKVRSLFVRLLGGMFCWALINGVFSFVPLFLLGLTFGGQKAASLATLSTIASLALSIPFMILFFAPDGVNAYIMMYLIGGLGGGAIATIASLIAMAFGLGVIPAVTYIMIGGGVIGSLSLAIFGALDEIVNSRKRQAWKSYA